MPNIQKILMQEVSLDQYISESGYTLAREQGLTPNGNCMNGKWVLRSPSGEMLDFDRFRNDIAERHNLTLGPLFVKGK